jgi:hypothetical protein
MSAETLIALASAMEDDQKAGLIQTVPRLVGGRTLLQHLTQFASGTYGPAVASGIAFWHRDQGNYWGHNAIIRTAAFASSAGLPELSGRKPFGGHILSHDFVEAVLLQRAAQHRRRGGARPALGAGQLAASGDRGPSRFDADGPRTSGYGGCLLSHFGRVGAVAHCWYRARSAGRPIHPELLRRQQDAVSDLAGD